MYRRGNGACDVTQTSRLSIQSSDRAVGRPFSGIIPRRTTQVTVGPIRRLLRAGTSAGHAPAWPVV